MPTPTSNKWTIREEMQHMTGNLPELPTARDVEAIDTPLLDTPRERSRAGDRPSRHRTPIPNNSLEALQARHDARHVMPHPELVTKVEVYDVNKDSTLLKTIDFSSLVRRFPAHDALIRQLIVGMNAIVTATTLPSLTFVVNKENAISDFITFLHDAQWPPQNRTHVLRVADISVDTATSYAIWLEARRPGRTRNHVLYNHLKKIITNLRADYPNDPAIGPQLIWPIGPALSHRSLEPYPMHVLVLQRRILPIATKSRFCARS